MTDGPRRPGPSRIDQRNQSIEGDEYHLDGKTDDYFTSVVELVEFYRRNSLMKVKPTESEFQTITGRPSNARKGSFLGVQGRSCRAH